MNACVCVSFLQFFFLFFGITPLPFVNMNRKHETKRRIEGRQKERKRKDDTTQLKRGAKVCVLLKGKTLSFYYRYLTFFGVFLL